MIPEVGKLYRRKHLSENVRCLYVGTDFMLAVKEGYSECYEEVYATPLEDIEWELVPNKHTLYVWLIRHMSGGVVSVIDRDIELGKNYNERGWTILSCTKIELEEGAMCDEWKQALAAEEKKDRSDAGNASDIDNDSDDIPF